MEERVVGRSDMEREKDEEFVKNRKLLKLVDKYKAELSERIAEVQDLKARLLESSDIRVSRLSQHTRSDHVRYMYTQLMFGITFLLRTELCSSSAIWRCWRRPSGNWRKSKRSRRTKFTGFRENWRKR